MEYNSYLVYSSLESSNLIGQLEGSIARRSRSTTCSIPPSRHLVNLVKSAILIGQLHSNEN